jgi:hypothetical protein
MPCLERAWRPFDYSALDEQIGKFRKLAEEYRRDNAEYYGEYLSSILFDDECPEARDAQTESHQTR